MPVTLFIHYLEPLLLKNKIESKTVDKWTSRFAVTYLESKQVFAKPLNGNQGNAKKMYGVRWEPLDKLLTDQPVADAENKPVFWFRVLGDLEGFM